MNRADVTFDKFKYMTMYEERSLSHLCTLKSFDTIEDIKIVLLTIELGQRRKEINLRTYEKECCTFKCICMPVHLSFPLDIIDSRFLFTTYFSSHR